MKARGVEKTVILYPRFMFLSNCHFWAPVFFLYFASRFSISQVFLMEAVYYFSVSVLEVPSGYFSDRLSRKWTLASAICFLGTASILFYSGTRFITFILAQMAMAAGFAFVSGTDTALHYEALKKLGRESEYARREAEVGGLVFLSGALAAVVGGVAGFFSLRLVYLFSFLGLSGALVCVCWMEDPGKSGPETPSLPFYTQVKVLMKRALGHELRPLFLFAVFLTVLVHIPYEFYQPYLKRIPGAFGGTGPLSTGFHLAATMLAGAWSTRFIPGLTRRYGAWSLLFATVFALVFLIALMAFSYHGFIACLLLLRTVPKALAYPVINALASPRLPDSRRSTYLSLQSLCGRLAYGCVLLVMSVVSRLSPEPLQGALTVAACIGIALVAWIVFEKRFADSGEFDTVFGGEKVEEKSPPA